MRAGEEPGSPDLLADTLSTMPIERVAKRGAGDALTSSTTSDPEMIRNLHLRDPNHYSDTRTSSQSSTEGKLLPFRKGRSLWVLSRLKAAVWWSES